MAKILKFRGVKHAAPGKLKVLVEDLPRSSWLARLTAGRFAALVGLAATTSFTLAVLLS
ncbi:hypothetical protein P7F60_17620 [Rhizobium sp. YJ-22]|uniref:hypothetical protein n=1 Tax=Rhizobium sp. YJ-22 TaxID=3037556 RepID=UPI001ACD1D6D|nr:hypothetical protein [Rhizobium sp. YJ-22]MBN9033275.1 hypothetical protein [Hyphomicrobiales bacterium]MDG3578218.1 hypothetical protein [Rhizobium sp. YJ-22]